MRACRGSSSRQTVLTCSPHLQPIKSIDELFMGKFALWHFSFSKVFTNYRRANVEQFFSYDLSRCWCSCLYPSSRHNAYRFLWCLSRCFGHSSRIPSILSDLNLSLKNKKISRFIICCSELWRRLWWVCNFNLTLDGDDIHTLSTHYVPQRSVCLLMKCDAKC